MNHYLQTCRFCGKQDHGGSTTMVKYAVRHHAHHACYLDAGKSLSDLHAWQIGTFPFRLIKDRGLMDVVERLTAATPVIDLNKPFSKQTPEAQAALERLAKGRTA